MPMFSGRRDPLYNYQIHVLQAQKNNVFFLSRFKRYKDSLKSDKRRIILLFSFRNFYVLVFQAKMTLFL